MLSKSMDNKAYFLVKNGAAKDAFDLREVNLPTLAADQLEIKVSAFGLNYADVMARAGLYKECPSLPAVIGYEVVGTVMAQGDRVEGDWIGKRVVAFTRFGGYAQVVRTNFRAVADIGDYPTGKALCLATQYVTAYYMTHVLLHVRPKEWVLVHAAAGGVGIALLDLLKIIGANVIAKVGGAEKKKFLEERGLTHVVDYKAKNYVLFTKSILDGEKLGASFNPVGGSTFKKDFSLIGAGGRLVLFGASEMSGKKWGFFSMLNFARKMGVLMPISLVMTAKSLLGVNMLKIADEHPEVLQYCLKNVVDLAKDGKVQPHVGEEFSHENLAHAHELLAAGKSMGKVVVYW